MQSSSPRRWSVIGPITLATLILSGALLAPAAGLGATPRAAGAARVGSPLLSSAAAVTATPLITPTLTSLPAVTSTVTSVVSTATSAVATLTTVARTATSTITTVVTPAHTATGTPRATGTATTVAPPAATSTHTAVPHTATLPAANTPGPAVTNTPGPASTVTSAVTATLAVSPSTVSQGGLTFATGGGFLPGEKVAISLHGQVLAQPQADVAGNLPLSGFGVPYTTTTGSQQVVASGLTSHRVATDTISVVALHPTLTVNRSNVTPTNKVTVNGCGFGARERVVLALNGSALITTPGVITTTTAGCFSATLSVPYSLLAGANTLSASGSTSRGTALVTLIGSLPVASTWFFAGASTMSGQSPLLDLLNTSNETALVTLTVMYADRAAGTNSFNVAGHTRLTVDLRNLAGSDARFGLVVRANRDVSASLTEQRADADQWTIPGLSATSTTWYLAEGYTGLTLKESIAVLNPGSTPATVNVNLLPFNGRPARTVPYTVPPEQEIVVDVNALMPRQSLSAIVTSGQRIVVERTMTFGTGNFGAHAKQGTNLSAVTWYFAEGSTLNNFETFLTVLNPNPTQVAFVTASYFSSTGVSLGNQTIQIDPLHRGNFRLNDLVHSSAIATIVSANVPVVVERPMYFGPPNGGPSGGSDVFGRNGTGTTYIFPSGNTSTMREFLLLLNPNSHAAQVRTTFYTNTGQVVTHDLTVPPFARANVDVNRDVPGLPLGDHGVSVKSLNGIGIVAEQSIYSSNFRSGSGSQGIAR